MLSLLVAILGVWLGNLPYVAPESICKAVQPGRPVTNSIKFYSMLLVVFVSSLPGWCQLILVIVNVLDHNYPPDTRKHFVAFMHVAIHEFSPLI